MLIISLMGLGPVVDLFVYLGGTFPLTTWGQQQMPQILVFSEWFYIIIRIIALIFMAHPFIHVFKRHSYVDEPQDEFWG